MLPTASSRSRDASVPRDQVVASPFEEKVLGGGVDGSVIVRYNYTDRGRKLRPRDGAKEVEAHKMQRRGTRASASIELVRSRSAPIPQKRRCRITSNMTTTERERLAPLPVKSPREDRRNNSTAFKHATLLLHTAPIELPSRRRGKSVPANIHSFESMGNKVHDPFMAKEGRKLNDNHKTWEESGPERDMKMPRRKSLGPPSNDIFGSHTSLATKVQGLRLSQTGGGVSTDMQSCDEPKHTGNKQPTTPRVGVECPQPNPNPSPRPIPFLRRDEGSQSDQSTTTWAVTAPSHTPSNGGWDNQTFRVGIEDKFPNAWNDEFSAPQRRGFNAREEDTSGVMVTLGRPTQSVGPPLVSGHQRPDGQVASAVPSAHIAPAPQPCPIPTVQLLIIPRTNPIPTNPIPRIFPRIVIRHRIDQLQLRQVRAEEERRVATRQQEDEEARRKARQEEEELRAREEKQWPAPQLTRDEEELRKKEVRDKDRPKPQRDLEDQLLSEEEKRRKKEGEDRMRCQYDEACSRRQVLDEETLERLLRAEEERRRKWEADKATRLRLRCERQQSPPGTHWF